MFEIINAGGWAMLPLIACSIIAMAIVGERLWTLRQKQVLPRDLFGQVWYMARNRQLDAAHIQALREGSPLGRILAMGLVNVNDTREVMKESIEEAGRHVVHDLERYLTTLGTIASISPLLGLLGSVTGLMEVFDAMTTQGVGNPQALAGGISEIMIATATGLAVAIPSLIFYRYFHNLIDNFAVRMEQQALKLVELIYDDRRRYTVNKERMQRAPQETAAPLREAAE